MAYIPQDPVILLSFINTKLRDEFASLDELCSTYDTSREDIDSKLNPIGYVYNSEKNAYL